jgi:hypothetical protein
MSDESGRETVSLSEHEARLRQVAFQTREYIAADWATSNLASVIQLAGASGWASQAGQHREHAIAILSVRILRACRASMGVLAAGWETEGLGVARQVVEINARLCEVTADQTPETGRLYLLGKPKTSIGAAIRAATPEVNPSAVADLYRALSRYAHADVGGIMRHATVDDDLRASITWGPEHTEDTQLFLLVCGSLAAEAATRLAVEADVEHPNRDALSTYLHAVERELATARGWPDA